MSVCWIDEISPERYRPMMRLLDESDFQYLRSQPGITARRVAQLRIQRCRLFREYLRSLNADFKRICRALRKSMAESGQDRDDFARLLLRREAEFAWAMLRVQFRLILFSWGVGHVEVAGLVKLLESLRMQLQNTAHGSG